MAEERKKTLSVENKTARRKYEILDTIEAGLVLQGSEVKSLRIQKPRLDDAYVTIKDNELFLINLKIPLYPGASYFNHEEARSRKLLLKRSEIIKMIARIKEKNLTVTALKLYFNERGMVKVLLGIGRGKKDYDRREDERKAEAKREVARALKDANR